MKCHSVFMQLNNNMHSFELLEQAIPSNKAIFMAGIPGGGKSTIAASLAGSSFRMIDVDQVYRLFQKRGREVDYDQNYAELDAPRKRRLAFFQKRGSNLVIDGTGRSITSVQVINQSLLELGYDTAMIYVDVNPATAVHNTIRREFSTGRAVSSDYIYDVADKLRGNIPIFKQMFGTTNFFTVNTDSMDFTKPIYPQVAPAVIQRLNRFLRKS